ncbi:hypothetical protein NC653_028836 [Populus alba x Populus x berolinensis]|uniref:Uncharacterized protein n=1 Tax=Populus alba x Populus x berolinensis TaxID=444605 RepID=A0AAD6M120_9ROSI|nr:hypothetical protein NC653_028831 [Populus alba x Populus x berolinensis]KAJ6976787.1 hypothetical protein NC653_028836 [Populus alba x Populus x berolinensis]
MSNNKNRKNKMSTRKLSFLSSLFSLTTWLMFFSIITATSFLDLHMAEKKYDILQNSPED